MVESSRSRSRAAMWWRVVYCSGHGTVEQGELISNNIILYNVKLHNCSMIPCDPLALYPPL